jgi:hypothetical protein
VDLPEWSETYLTLFDRVMEKGPTPWMAFEALQQIGDCIPRNQKKKGQDPNITPKLDFAAFGDLIREVIDHRIEHGLD